MAFTWQKVNPDGALDLLPLPYRIIDEVVEDIVEAVGEQVDIIETRKRSEACEFSLPEAQPTSLVQVSGHIACAYVEPRGTTRMAVGTSQGEALLIDSRKGEVVAHAHPFHESEPVTCVSICSESAYQDVFAGPGVDAPALPSPNLKLFAAGLTTPKILVYDIHKETYGVMLKPACAVHLPAAEGGDSEEQHPVIEQLHTRGCAGGIWACVLLPDGNVRCYLTPLGEPDLQDEEANVVLDAPIQEGDEDEDEEAAGEAPGPGEEFAKALQVNTATYSFSLMKLAIARNLPMPELDTITLNVFSPRPRDGAYGTGVSSGQVPTLCFSSSAESNVVLAHFIPAPRPIVAAAGLDLDSLLMQAVPPHGLLNDPEATQSLQPRRRWTLPAKTSSIAVSPNGGIVAIGGAQGSVALVNAATGPSLRTMLPGHYGAVNALAFFRDKTLVSAGADCWVHKYCMQTDTLLARHLAAPPPLSSTVLRVAASQSMPLAVTMDGEGGLRLWDLKRGTKVGSMACVSPPPPPSKEDDDEQAEVQRIVLKEDETPKLLLHTAAGFCVICMAVEQPMEGVDPDMETEEPPPDGPVDDGDDRGDEPEATLPPSEERAVLVFFDNAHMLKKLFPTLASKAGDKGDITKLYEAISKEDLAKLQPQGPASTLTKATKLAARRAPPDPAAVRAAKELADRTLKGTKKSRSGKLDTSNTMIAKLTAENLRKFAAAQAAQKEEAAGGAKKASSFGSMGFARSATNTVDRAKAEEAAPHGVPRN